MSTEPSDMVDLTRLQSLYSKIHDLTGLEFAPNLMRLDLSLNLISDLSPLVANRELANGDRVVVFDNPLSYESINTHIPTLIARGVLVIFDNQAHPALLKISGDNAPGLPGASLAHPFVVGMQDENGFAIEGIPVTFAITAGDGRLSVTNTVTDAFGRAETRLTLGPGLGTTTISASADGVESTVTFSATASIIPDSNLRIGLQIALRKAPDDPIVPAEMITLTELNLNEAGISDLTGLEFATNLTILSLLGNNISDLSPVADLTNLTKLELADNSISNVEPVLGLTSLTYLGLSHNAVSDVAPLASLANLRSLSLNHNTVSDIAPLAGLTNLTYLGVSHNLISNIAPLAGLTFLTYLNLNHNLISDVSHLSVLTELTTLEIRENSIANVAPFAGLTQLTSLGLSQNLIWDIAPVEGLTGLTELALADNSISDLLPLVFNRGLESDDVINVIGNPLSHLSINTHIPTLIARGVQIFFENQAHPALLKISGDYAQGLPGATLAHPFVVEMQDENGSTIEGVPVKFAVTAGDGRLRITDTTTDAFGRAESTLTLGPNLGATTVTVSAAGVGYTLTFNAVAIISEFKFAVPSGISLIHVPLRVTTVDGAANSVDSVSDLYDVLGGAAHVNLLITYEPDAQKWHSYLGVSDRDSSADPVLTDDLGIIAVMDNAVTVHLEGDGLGAPVPSSSSHNRGQREASISLLPGVTLVDVPLRDSRITRVKDLFSLDGIRNNVTAIIVSDSSGFKVVGQSDDSSDIPIAGGQAFVMIAKAAATITISGNGWDNITGTASRLPAAITGIEVGSVTPVLGLVKE